MDPDREVGIHPAGIEHVNIVSAVRIECERGSARSHHEHERSRECKENPAHGVFLPALRRADPRAVPVHLKHSLSMIVAGSNLPATSVRHWAGTTKEQNV